MAEPMTPNTPRASASADEIRREVERLRAEVKERWRKVFGWREPMLDSLRLQEEAVELDRIADRLEATLTQPEARHDEH